MISNALKLMETSVDRRYVDSSSEYGLVAGSAGFGLLAGSLGRRAVLDVLASASRCAYGSGLRVAPCLFDEDGADNTNRKNDVIWVQQ